MEYAKELEVASRRQVGYGRRGHCFFEEVAQVGGKVCVAECWVELGTDLEGVVVQIGMQKLKKPNV